MRLLSRLLQRPLLWLALIALLGAGLPLVSRHTLPTAYAGGNFVFPPTVSESVVLPPGAPGGTPVGDGTDDSTINTTLGNPRSAFIFLDEVGAAGPLNLIVTSVTGAPPPIFNALVFRREDGAAVGFPYDITTNNVGTGGNGALLVIATCNASAIGSATFVITVNHNDSSVGGGTSVININCNVAGVPGFEFQFATPLTLTAQEDATDPSSAVGFRNSGSGNLSITGVSITGGPTLSVSSPPLPFTVPPTGVGIFDTISIVVTCDSAVAGTFTGTLTINHNAVGSPATKTVTCTITKADLSIAPAGVNLTPVPGGSAVTSPNVIISNTGNGTATFSVGTPPVLAPAPSGDYQIRFSLNGSAYTADLTTLFQSATILAGGTATLNVECQALVTATIPYTGVLTLNYQETNSPIAMDPTPPTLNVNCTPTSANANFAPPGPNITLTTIPSGTATQSITITETGNANLAFSPPLTTQNLVNTAGVGTLELQPVGGDINVIPDGGPARTFNIVCNGTGPGTLTHTLNIGWLRDPFGPVSAPNLQTKTYNITCNIGAAELTSSPVAPGPISLQAAPGASASQTVTLTRVGSVNVHFNPAPTDIVVTGAPQITTSTTDLVDIIGGVGGTRTFNVVCNVPPAASPGDTYTSQVTVNYFQQPPNLNPTTIVFDVDCTVVAAVANFSVSNSASNPTPALTTISIPTSGFVNIGSSQTVTVFVHETGNANLLIDAEVLPGGDPEIAISSSTAGWFNGSLNNPGFNITNGGPSRSITLTCTVPASATVTQYTKTIRFSYRQDPALPALTTSDIIVNCLVGRAIYGSVPAPVAVSPAPSPTPPFATPQFSLQAAVGFTSPVASTLTINNTGNIDMQFNVAFINGFATGTASSNVSQFSTGTTPLPASITAGGSQQVSPRCTPTTGAVGNTIEAVMRVQWKPAPSLPFEEAYYTVRCTITTPPAPPRYSSTPAQSTGVPLSTVINMTAPAGGSSTSTISITNLPTVGFPTTQDLLITGVVVNPTGIISAAPNTLTIQGNLTQSITVTCAFPSSAVVGNAVTAAITVSHNGPNPPNFAGTAAQYGVKCTVSAPTATPDATTAAGTAAAGTGTPVNTTPVASTAVSQCTNTQVLTTPFPQNASGEFLLVNCFNIAQGGQVNITLSQVLTNPYAGVRESDITTIQGNAGLMSVWRMGSWFLTPSTYNAATQTYTFTSEPTPSVYVFFYGGITRPVGSQSSIVAGTTTGNVPGATLPTEVVIRRRNNLPLAALVSTGLVMILAGGWVMLRHRKAARASQTE